MPVAYIANQSAAASHAVAPDGFSAVVVQFGTELNLEEIARKLVYVRPSEDILMLHGEPTIVAACVAVWLEWYGMVTVHSQWHQPRILSKGAIQKQIIHAQDEVSHGR